MANLTFPKALQQNKRPFWPLSYSLLKNILDDQITDRFVVELVWERLGYVPVDISSGIWKPSSFTPQDWSLAFPEAPELISQRKASIQLTRSIPSPYKQLLKEKLKFNGYQIGELYPRRTRRATAVNWLIAWTVSLGKELADVGPIPALLPVPENPLEGHPGDPSIA
ncbi:DUF1823 family protein [Prochlorococcus sp. MIT 1341]|uniref:DUF1823 family protein n=1 Tax=Prochlorococcus sp. MIT 1341 TaxID=3096221 RepID=UPI002A747DA6|nr:DUF1823 family protein [Prochlorococcus sp. MIT 1341]